MVRTDYGYTDTNLTYGYWADEANVTSATTATCITDAWISWSFVSDGTAAVANEVWVQWTDQEVVPRRSETSREVAQREREEAERERLNREHDERTAKADKEYEEAERKAFKLLSENLTKTQLKSLNKDGFFLIKVPSGNEYNIHKGRVQNVISLDKFRKKKNRLCAHPNTDCPDYDTMLAQKLMLEHKEKDFLAIANVS